MRSNVCVRSQGQNKALVGADVVNIFDYDTPTPLAEPPAGVLTVGGLPVPITFEGEDPIQITALTDGRRKLTLSSLPTRALTGSRGKAFIVSEQICWECIVQKYSTEGTTAYAYLRDALGATLPVGETCYLYFRHYSAQLPPQTEPTEPLDFAISFSGLPQFGGNDFCESYYVRYVHHVFSTGITESDVRAYFKSFQPAPSDDEGVGAALTASEDWLAERIGLELRETDQELDDILAPQIFRRAQLFYAAAYAFLLTDTQRYEALKKEAYSAFKAACSQVFIDRDRDGKVSQQDVTTIGKAKLDCSYYMGGRQRRRRW